MSGLSEGALRSVRLSAEYPRGDGRCGRGVPTVSAATAAAAVDVWNAIPTYRPPITTSETTASARLPATLFLPRPQPQTEAVDAAAATGRQDPSGLAATHAPPLHHPPISPHWVKQRSPCAVAVAVALAVNG